MGFLFDVIPVPFLLLGRIVVRMPTSINLLWRHGPPGYFIPCGFGACCSRSEQELCGSLLGLRRSIFFEPNDLGNLFHCCCAAGKTWPTYQLFFEARSILFYEQYSRARYSRAIFTSKIFTQVMFALFHAVLSQPSQKLFRCFISLFFIIYDYFRDTYKLFI